MALVLTRRESERLAIGDEIIVTICKVSGKRVQVAIEAPKGCDIKRLPKVIHIRKDGEAMAAG